MALSGLFTYYVVKNLLDSTNEVHRGSPVHDEYDYSSKNKKPEFIDYLECEISEGDSSLGEFFHMIEEEYFLEFKKEYQFVEQKYDELLERLEFFHQFEKKLKSHNIFFHFIINSNHPKLTSPVISINNFSIHFHTYEEFLQLVKQRYLDLMKQAEIIEKKAKDMQEQADQAEKEYKRAIFKRNDKYDYYCEIHRNAYQLGSSHKKKLEEANAFLTILKMSQAADSKEDFKKALEEIIDLFKIRETYTDINHKHYMYKDKYIPEESTIVNNDILERVFCKLIEEGKINETTFEKVLLLIGKVSIKQNNGEYELSKTTFKLNNKSKGIILWFLQNVEEIQKIYFSQNFDIDEENISQEDEKPKTFIKK